MIIHCLYHYLLVHSFSTTGTHSRMLEGIANIPSSPGGTKDRPEEISVLE